MKARSKGLILLAVVFGLAVAGSTPALAAGAPTAGSQSTLAIPWPAPITPNSLIQARADRPDASSRPRAGEPQLGAAALAAIPTGQWQALGPAPIGPSALAGGGSWGSPNSGRVTGLALIPSGAHAGSVVAGTAGGGIWTSADTGSTWTAVTDHAPSLAIGALADDPSNPDHLLAGMGEGNQTGDSYPGFGMLSSIDGGQTWSVQDPGGAFDGSHVSAVAISPANAMHMFAATDRGLFLTTDGGASWAKPSDPSYAAVDGVITAVVIDPTLPTTLYIGGGAAVVAKSSDGGVHWTAAATGIAKPGAVPPETSPLIALALAPSSHSTLYASVGTGTPVALYRSSSGGSSWSKLKAAPDYTSTAYAYGGGENKEGGFFTNVLAVDPTNANHVLAGSVALVETKDGGTSWANVNGQPFFGSGTNLLHPDQHALAFRGDGKAWIGDDGGVYLYDPSTKSVTNENGNLNVTQFYAGFSAVNGQVLAGAQDNSSARSNGSSLAWTAIYLGDGGPSAITPNHTAMQFIEANQSLLVTADAFAAEPFPREITPPQPGFFIAPMVVVANAAQPSNPTVFYGGPDLYRTTNPSASAPLWTQVTSVGKYVTALVADPTNPQVVYVGFQDGTIQVSSDGGSTFSSLAAGPFAGHWVTGLSVDPSNPKAITASSSSFSTRRFLAHPHVAQYAYASTPQSGTWTLITGDLPQSAVSRVVYDNGALVAATDIGVYATSSASGASTAWSLVGSGLPAVQVQDLDVESDGLYAVTHGRGAWKLPLAATVMTVKPNTGPVGGGTTVTVTGTNFSGATAVRFGSASATSFTVKSATSLTAVSPAETAGTVDVTVTTPGGTSAISSKDRFKFTPTVTNLSPNSGSKAGGTKVTATGTGFGVGTTTTSFKFGTAKGTSVNCTSTTTCTVVAPAHAVGKVDVMATVNKASSPKTTADQFTYN